WTAWPTAAAANRPESRWRTGTTRPRRLPEPTIARLVANPDGPIPELPYWPAGPPAPRQKRRRLPSASPTWPLHRPVGHRAPRPSYLTLRVASPGPDRRFEAATMQTAPVPPRAAARRAVRTDPLRS